MMIKPKVMVPHFQAYKLVNNTARIKKCIRSLYCSETNTDS